MIIRVAKRRQYTQIDNRAVEDDRLSFKALGLLTYLLSRPDSWEANYRHLATTHTDGESGVRSGLTELQDAGYIVRERLRDTESGHFVWVHVVFEHPDDHASISHAWETHVRKTHVRENAPEEELEATTTETTKTETKDEGADAPLVESLCDQLAAAIEAHGTVKARPAVTERWRRDMRLLVQRGPLRVEKAEAIPADRVGKAIAYVFEHLADPSSSGFCWADQIRSPHALRDHWVQLLEAGHRQQTMTRGRVATMIDKHGRDSGEIGSGDVPISQLLRPVRAIETTATEKEGA